MSFNPIERKIAETLNRFPRIKQATKHVYQRSNYFIFGDRDFTFDVHPKANLLTPAQYFDETPFNKTEFFGYFDTSPWNQRMDSLVYHRPTNNRRVSLWVYQRDSSRSIAASSAWNFQQGCRTRWHPTRSDQILYNDIQNGSVITNLIDTAGSKVETYDHALQSISPSSQEFVSLNYHRLDRNRPDYGYGVDDQTKIRRPSEDGLWRVNTESNSSELIVPLSELIDNDVDHKDHYLNHVLYNPSGDQFAFLHRWQGPQGRVSRLYVSDRFGDTQLIMDDGIVSHYCWLNDDRILVWGRTERHGDGYHIINVENNERDLVQSLDEYGDGHPSISPDGQWIVTDTYPDRSRRRHLLLLNLETNEVIEIGRFLSPFGFEGTERCDLHPRWSPDGTAISIDSAHDGTRRSYILDVSSLVSTPSRRNVR